VTHRRTLLRNAFVARLQAAALSLQGRAYSGRLMPLEEDALPAAIVHTRDAEKVINRSVSGWNGYERRRCIVSIVLVVQEPPAAQDEDGVLDTADIDAILDDLGDEVEQALQAWTIPGFESADAELLDTSSGQLEVEGSLPTFAATLRYQVDYTTPYRDCSHPYVVDDDDIMRSGAYPGGQVTPGCPTANTGEACPIGDVQLFSQEEPIN